MIRHLSADEKVRQEAYYREKRLHDEANALGGARKEGIAEGIEIGRTEERKAIAEKIYERHLVLTDLLERIGVEPETAAADACRVEHVISDETFAKLKDCQAEMNKKSE